LFRDWKAGADAHDLIGSGCLTAQKPTPGRRCCIAKWVGHKAAHSTVVATSMVNAP